MLRRSGQRVRRTLGDDSRRCARRPRARPERRVPRAGSPGRDPRRALVRPPGGSWHAGSRTAMWMRRRTSPRDRHRGRARRPANGLGARWKLRGRGLCRIARRKLRDRPTSVGWRARIGRATGDVPIRSGGGAVRRGSRSGGRRLGGAGRPGGRGGERSRRACVWAGGGRSRRGLGRKGRMGVGAREPRRRIAGGGSALGRRSRGGSLREQRGGAPQHASVARGGLLPSRRRAAGGRGGRSRGRRRRRGGWGGARAVCWPCPR